MDDTQKKQQYLKTNILDGGYDVQLFQDYLANSKEDGTNINNWQFPELKLAVKLFMKKQDEIKEKQQEQEQSYVPQELLQQQQQEKESEQQRIEQEKAQQLLKQQQEEEQKLKQQQIQEQQNLQQQKVTQSAYIPSDDKSSNSYQQNNVTQSSYQPSSQKPSEVEEDVLVKCSEINSKQQSQQSDSNGNQDQDTQSALQQKQDEINQKNNENRKQSHRGSEIQNGKPKDKNDFQSYVNCKQSQLTDFFNNNNVSIILRDYEKKAGGIFSSSYIAYKINTQPQNWLVERRFNDFFQLKNILTKLYPALVIPPIKKPRTKSQQSMFLIKRMHFLEKFLNKIIKNPELKACKYVEGFLRMQNDKEWQALVKEGDKIKPPLNQSIKSLASIKGEIEIGLNSDINNYCDRATEFFHNMDPVYKKIRQLSKQLIVDHDQISSTLYNIGDCFSQLYTQSYNFNSNLKQETDKNLLLDDIYVTLNNMSVQWGNTLNSQIKVVQENISNFFKYYNSEGRQINQNLKVRNDQHKKYQDFQRKLNDKKEKLFAMQQIQQWDLSRETLKKYSENDLKQDKQLSMEVMLPKETQQEHELRDMSAYYSKNLVNEIKRLTNEKVQEYADHFVQFGHLQTDNIQEMHVLWADAMTSLKQLGDGGRKLTMLQRIEKVKEENDEGCED